MKQRNRAKCKLCGSIVESILPVDLQMCECGEIGVDGGLEKYLTIFGSAENFIRIDDEGHEMPIQVIDEKKEDSKPWIKSALQEEIKDETTLPAPDRKDLIEYLKLYIEQFDRLPEHAKYQSATVYDMQSFAQLMYRILKTFER